MQYDFYIQTKDGLKNAMVDCDSDFDCAPFGYVPYREISTCTCAPTVTSDFWNCVDEVLTANNQTSLSFVRAVRAYSNGILYGESLDP